MNPIERRYARLVRLYPAHSPRDEILDTLLQSGERPTLRETSALVLGALRARAGSDVHRTPREFAHSATRLAALALLVYAVAVDLLSSLPLDVPAILGSPPGILQYAVAGLVGLALHVVALVTLARGAYRLAAFAAVLAVAPSAIALEMTGSYLNDGFWAAPVAALLVPAVNLSPVRERSSPAPWLAAVPVAVIALPTGLITMLGPAFHLQQQTMIALVVLGLAWSLVDARVPLAVAALVLCDLLTHLTAVSVGAVVGEGTPTLGIAVTAAPVLVLLGAAAVSRRRTVL
ncbi:hypothetical protein [Actinoplanes sp. NPDC049802]|uniref:hypothetical protein n=1 Tax=Actinoplanes sp. NPDC049802 TaxID=3154742 RepID=UPI0033DA0F9D